MPSFIARVRSTVIEDYEVEAKDEFEARRKLVAGEGTLCHEIERPDWEIESVRLND